jgi:hypothetical protein
MAFPLMFSGLVFVPTIVSYIALLILFIAGIAEYRQGHIGRIAITGNAFLLWQIFFIEWSNLLPFLQWYLNIGTILGVVAIISYLWKFSLPSKFYSFAYFGYGSFSIFIITFFSIFL